MNRNPYQYKPYDKHNKYINKSHRNNNFLSNNHKNGHFQPNNFQYTTKKNRNAYQGNVNRMYSNNNNNNNDNYSSMPREREKKMCCDEEMHVHAEKCWKRKKNDWKEIQKNSNQDSAVDAVPQTNLPPKWCKEDAMKAIEIEHAFNHLQSNQFVLRFPDPFIDKSIIQGYSSAIVDVRVQQPITPRYV